MVLLLLCSYASGATLALVFPSLGDEPDRGKLAKWLNKNTSPKSDLDLVSATSDQAQVVESLLARPAQCSTVLADELKSYPAGTLLVLPVTGRSKDTVVWAWDPEYSEASRVIMKSAPQLPDTVLRDTPTTVLQVWWGNGEDPTPLVGPALDVYARSEVTVKFSGMDTGEYRDLNVIDELMEHPNSCVHKPSVKLQGVLDDWSEEGRELYVAFAIAGNQRRTLQWSWDEDSRVLKRLWRLE